MQLKPIAEQVVAVVGASSGLGRETAVQFAKKQAKVVVSGRSEAKIASLVDEIRSFQGEVTPVIADVAEFDQVKAIADKAVEVYGRLDTWVHVPGTALFALFEETKPEEFKRVIEVNLAQGLSAQNNPPLRNNDTVIIGRSSIAGISDTVGNILSPLSGVFGLFRLLGL